MYFVMFIVMYLPPDFLILFFKTEIKSITEKAKGIKIESVYVK